MSRRFFDQIDDELRGLVGPRLRDFRSQRTARLVKVWYIDPAVHFEAQLVSQRWAPRKRPVIEVGLHLENPSREKNDEILESIERDRSRWAPKLSSAEAGKAFGPQSRTWRRLSELVDVEALDDSDFGGEVAERLASYVRTLHPLLFPAGARGA